MHISFCLLIKVSSQELWDLAHQHAIEKHNATQGAFHIRAFIVSVPRDVIFATSWRGGNDYYNSSA